MALSASIVWEVRQDGSDNNGGGCKTGAAGTDYSQQAAAQKSGTDLEMHASTNTKVKPTAAGVAAADIGNLIQITAGTNWTTGFYEITAQDGTYWTLDRSPAAAGETNKATYAMGGALATPGGQKGGMAAGNTMYIKYDATPITLTTGSANTAGGPLQTISNVGNCLFVGYDTTRTVTNSDANRPTIRAGVNSTVMLSTNSSSRGHHFRQLIFDANGKTSCTGYAEFADRNSMDSVKANGFATSFSGGVLAIACESVGHTTAGFDSATAIGCVARDGTAVGFKNGYCIDCISDSNSGASTDGFVANVFGGHFINCTAYNNGRHGFDLSSNNGVAVKGINLLSYGNSGYGFATGTQTMVRNYAAGSNTSGSVSGTPVSLTAIVSLSADPFTNAAAGDFSLNNTAGGGAACRAAGFPGAYPGGLTTGYLDIGAVQHQDSGGTAGARLVGPSALVTPGII